MYGVVAGDRIFDLNSFFFKGALITCGEEKNFHKGETTRSRILHILAEQRSKIEEIARSFDLPFE